jgi:hypothetical protein
MSRVVARANLVVLIAAALVMSVFTPVAPAHADGPITQTRTVVYPFNELDNETVLGLAADVTPVPAPYGNYDLTGTVTFRDDQGNVLATDVPVAPDNGYAQAYVPKPTQPTTYYADFHGTGVFADSSSGGKLYTPSSLRTVIVTAEPSIARITSGVPQLTLTLAARARFKDGTPAPGVNVDFLGPCLIDGPRGCQQRIQWCSAISDGTGLASCNGAGLLGSLSSILTGGVTYVAYSRNSGYYVAGQSGTVPVILRS